MNFSCVNCEVSFELQEQYKLHYKSQYHRYNIKRVMIGLIPLSYSDYIMQFQKDISCKSSTQRELHCEICSKKFKCVQTYKQHLNSNKHKNNRNKLKKENQSDSSSCSGSDYVVLGSHHKDKCFFCNQVFDAKHLKTAHRFPPFEESCVDLDGICQKVRGIVEEGICVYCGLQFDSIDSVKQHMLDVGHARLNLDVFNPYEPFYLWKIQEHSSESEYEQLTMQQPKLDESLSFVDIKETLESLQKKRLSRIKETPTGVIINNKEVGLRKYKNYYKQYLVRQIPVNEYRAKALGASETQKQSWKLVKRIQKAPKMFKFTPHQ